MLLVNDLHPRTAAVSLPPAARRSSRVAPPPSAVYGTGGNTNPGKETDTVGTTNGGEDAGMQLTHEMMDELVRTIVEAEHPREVILFGSRARDAARPDSDMDILVIKETDLPPPRRSRRLRRLPIA